MARKGCTCNDATCKICVRSQVRAEKELLQLREAMMKRRAKELEGRETGARRWKR